MWDPIKCDIIQTKHVEFVEDVSGYEYIYSKKILETPFTNTDNIDKVDDVDTVDEDYESATSETHEEHADDNAGSSNSHKTISEGKRNVGRPRKVVRNPWGCVGKPKNIELNLA